MTNSELLTKLDDAAAGLYRMPAHEWQAALELVDTFEGDYQVKWKARIDAVIWRQAKTGEGEQHE